MTTLKIAEALDATINPARRELLKLWLADKISKGDPPEVERDGQYRVELTEPKPTKR